MRYLIVALLAFPGVTYAADTIPGPIIATVVSVYDGDTLTVDAEPWPGLTARASVSRSQSRWRSRSCRVPSCRRCRHSAI